jgi:DHA1 family multidrug resistance protein-like MFS transporter
MEGNHSSTLDEKIEYDKTNTSQNPSRHEEPSAQFSAQHDSEQEDSTSTRTQTNEDQDQIPANEATYGHGEFKSSYLSMGGGKPHPPKLLGENEAYLVDFDGPDDPTHPQNWPMSTRSVRSNAMPQLWLTSLE